MSQDHLPPAVPVKFLSDRAVSPEIAELTAYTSEETQEIFLKKMKGVMEYWRDLPGKTLEERMFGFAFTIFSTIDGSAADVPGFRLMPDPHESDEAFHKENGERWFDPAVDIGGTLHDNWCRIHR